MIINDKTESDMFAAPKIGTKDIPVSRPAPRRIERIAPATVLAEGT